MTDHILKNNACTSDTYGIIKDDNQYSSMLDLLLKFTSETENRYQFFIKNILPHVIHKSMLDVGVGDGKLTALAGKYFEEIVMVDTSESALDHAEKSINNLDKKVHKIAGSITDINLSGNQFDLAIMSHTLYHVDAILWLEITQKIVASLKENGLLVIVLNGGLDKDLLAQQFNGKILDIDDFIKNCHEQLDVQSVDTFFSTENYKTDNLDTMLSIVGLHLYDVGGMTSRKNLIDFLNRKKDTQNNVYQFFVYQKFIMIRK